MKYYVDKSAEHIEKGIVKQKAGDLRSARQNFLRAAELLYQAAEKSTPALRERRIQRAEELISRSKELSSMMGGREGQYGGNKSEKTTDGNDGSDFMISERPNLKLDDVAGLDDVKEQIKIKMIYPFSHPEKAKHFGIKKGGGLLLYGPPGTGKTMIAKAIAGEIDAAFFTVKPSEIMSKWVGEAEQNVSRLFATARAKERAIIFIDEVESLVPKRSGTNSTVMARVVPQILAEMEGVGSDSEQGVLLFIAATNEPWAIDEAVRRPGRFDEKIYVTVPDIAARRKILSLNLEGKPLASDISLDYMAELLEGYSGADIRRICEKACDIPFLEAVTSEIDRDIEMQDLLEVAKLVKPSITPKMAEKFERFMSEGE